MKKNLRIVAKNNRSNITFDKKTKKLFNDNFYTCFDDILSGDNITIVGLTGSATDDGDLNLGGADSAKFTANSNAGTATWTQNTGTLVLTANAAVNANTNIVFTFDIAQPAAAQAAVSPTIATAFAAGNLASTTLTGSNILLTAVAAATKTIAERPK